MAGEDAGDRGRAQQNGRGIQLYILEPGVGVNLDTVVAGILLGIGLARLSHAGLFGILNAVNVLAGFFGDLQSLGGGCTGHDGAHYHADHAGDDQNLRALLLELETDPVESQVHRLDKFVLLHDQMSSLENDFAMDL